MYVLAVLAARSTTPVLLLILNPAGAELKDVPLNGPPVTLLIARVVEPIRQNVPPLTAAVGKALTVTVDVAVLLQLLAPVKL